MGSMENLWECDMGVRVQGRCYLTVQIYNQTTKDLIVQHSDYSQQYFIINFKVVQRLDLNCYHHTKKLCDEKEVLASTMMVIIL